MKNGIALLISFLCLWALNLHCNEINPVRGGIEFSFANTQITTIASDMYYSFDIQAVALGTGTNPRLGTGMVLINYNPTVFGEWVKTSNNVIITKGILLSTSPFPFYSIIANDNQASRLAVTFEYLVSAGWGNILEFSPVQLLNIKLKVNAAGNAGLSFAQSQMTGEQYQDDNATVLNPVIATDTENSFISTSPTSPVNLTLSTTNNIVTLSWQNVPGCTYNIYSAGNPESAVWQTEAIGITQPFWSNPIQAAKKFYRVTSQNNFLRR